MQRTYGVWVHLFERRDSPPYQVTNDSDTPLDASLKENFRPLFGVFIEQLRHFSNLLGRSFLKTRRRTSSSHPRVSYHSGSEK